MKTTIDHLIFVVRDLAVATERYAVLLGRQPSWRGTHPALGTHNTLFRLENTYLELLAAGTHPGGKGGPGAQFVADHLKREGPGLGGIVFGVPDADALTARLRRHGVAATDPMAGQGHDDQTGAIRHWRNVLWPSKAARGVFSFGIEHLDPEGLPMAEPHTESPITAVDHVVVTTTKPKAAKAFYGNALGIRLALELDTPEWGGQLLFFRTSHMSLEIIASKKADVDRDQFWGIALKTSNIEASHARLRADGVSVSDIRQGRKPGTRVCTVESHTLHVPTLLVGIDRSS